jgi:hypothetical protein
MRRTGFESIGPGASTAQAGIVSDITVTSLVAVRPKPSWTNTWHHRMAVGRRYAPVDRSEDFRPYFRTARLPSVTCRGLRAR